MYARMRTFACLALPIIWSNLWSDSATEQLRFFWEKASVAEAKTASSMLGCASSSVVSEAFLATWRGSKM